MNPTVFSAVLGTLRDNADLQALLGGPYVYRAYGVTPAHIPSITLLENNESSKLRAGYNSFRNRDSSPTLQVDIWINTDKEDSPCTGEDADMIAEKIDEILFAPDAVAGTYGWTRNSRSTQNDTDIGGIHIAIRYLFGYVVTDT
ncbi:MAG: hypothetical protein LUQ50_06380 [Methanospirillum sp.]|uniref:hypothetical protein n=1 Tax=Methanospirillum sp. TaxID=45200 RepID=UPI00236FF765|nr:hypothetical protein [Methanospirillum sp.]MDD1728680.1 hypothetical protein [Methanospirillum sp.]